MARDGGAVLATANARRRPVVGQLGGGDEGVGRGGRCSEGGFEAEEGAAGGADGVAGEEAVEID
jgi:hypothetical protein